MCYPLCILHIRELRGVNVFVINQAISISKDMVALGYPGLVIRKVRPNDRFPGFIDFSRLLLIWVVEHSCA